MELEENFIQEEIVKTRSDLKNNQDEFTELLKSPTFIDFLNGSASEKISKQHAKLKLNSLEHTYLCEKLNYYLNHAKA